MPRALYFCFAIVAAFQIPAAASPVEDIPLPASVVALADRLGIDAAHDRANFIRDIARLLYTNLDSKPPVLVAASRDREATEPALFSVPVPLPAAIWSRAIFHHTVPVDQLIVAILSDRRATLLCRGLAGLDDETLEYFAEHPVVLTYIYEHAAAPVRPTKVIGICLNTFDMSEAQARDAVARAADETGLPATDPVRFGSAPLVDAIIQGAMAAK